MVFNEVIFVHDKAPCMQANQTQHLLQHNHVKFCGNDIWPGNSLDHQAAEQIGTIIKDEVEKKILSKINYSRYLEEILQIRISDVSIDMETNTDLFETLL